jgi:OOP family OmpA-OmpF porin
VPAGRARQEGYLVKKGVDRSRIEAIGKGSADPKTTADQCKGAKGKKLIACLQPDRRVEITAVP